ncbi:DDE-type integrase/transposase/recombinase, partial [Alicyclobacillus suci]|uniref:DDE-type integrase/transposase/recombinase n=1 Tax=Alicyclobacillus suci TaxID=2816080 RepID=UPI001F348309
MANIMRESGLKSRTVRKYKATTNSKHNHPVSDNVLNQAYRRERPNPGVLHHSDRGSQYASKEYQDKLRDYGMISSMSRKGNCYDNA